MISPISSISVQSMAYSKQNIQPSSKANEEANESTAEKAREAHSDNPPTGRRLFLLNKFNINQEAASVKAASFSMLSIGGRLTFSNFALIGI